MNNFMQHHGWVALLAVTAINALWMLAKLAGPRAKDPDLMRVARRIVAGFAFWGSLPWIVMGVGLETHGLTMDAYIDHVAGPYVLAFYAVVIAEIVLGTWWVFRGGGADKLARCGWLFRGNVSSPGVAKAAWSLMVAGSVIAMIAIAFR